MLERIRQILGIEHGHVRFRGRPHVFQRMQETIVVLGDHRAAVHADAADLQRRPDRVAGEQRVVARNPGELDHAELHHHMVDQLLRLRLGDEAARQIALHIDIQERGDAPHGHRRAVLRLDRGQIAEIQPLAGFLRVGRGLADVKAVGGGHRLHALERLDLLGDFLAQADDVLGHRAVAAVGQILRLFLDQEINAVERDAAVVADDAAAAIGIRQAGDDLVVARLLHLRGVGHEHAFVVGRRVLGEDPVQLGVGFIAVVAAGFLRHLDAAERHERALERLVGLKTHNLLQILVGFADVAGAVSGQAGNDVRLHIQHTALRALLFLQFLENAPEFIRRLRWAGEEALVSRVRLVILLNEIANVDFFAPDAALEAFPLLKMNHANSPLRMVGRYVSEHGYCSIMPIVRQLTIRLRKSRAIWTRHHNVDNL